MNDEFVFLYSSCYRGEKLRRKDQGHVKGENFKANLLVKEVASLKESRRRNRRGLCLCENPPFVPILTAAVSFFTRSQNTGISKFSISRVLSVLCVHEYEYA